MKTSQIDSGLYISVLEAMELKSASSSDILWLIYLFRLPFIFHQAYIYV